MTDPTTAPRRAPRRRRSARRHAWRRAAPHARRRAGAIALSLGVAAAALHWAWNETAVPLFNAPKSTFDQSIAATVALAAVIALVAAMNAVVAGRGGAGDLER